MATFPPETARILIVATQQMPLGDSYVTALTAPRLIFLARKYPLVSIEVLRVAPSNGEAKKWIRAFKHKGGIPAWRQMMKEKQERMVSSKQKRANSSK